MLLLKVSFSLLTILLCVRLLIHYFKMLNQIIKMKILSFNMDTIKLSLYYFC